MVNTAIITLTWVAVGGALSYTRDKWRVNNKHHKDTDQGKDAICGGGVEVLEGEGEELDHGEDGDEGDEDGDPGGDALGLAGAQLPQEQPGDGAHLGEGEGEVEGEGEGEGEGGGEYPGPE